MTLAEDDLSPGRPTRRSVLHRRDYRLLLLSFTTSRFGDFLYFVALIAYVFVETGSAGWVAAATLSRFVPSALLSPFAGLIADRHERRLVMATGDCVQFVVMVAMTVLAAISGPVLPMVVLSSVAASASTLYRAATSTLVTTLVPEDELATANSLISAIEESAFVVGPAGGGLLLLLGHPAIAFGINAATFAVSAAFLLAIRARSKRADSELPASAWAELREGARALLGNRVVLVLVGCLTAGTLVYGVEMVALVLVSSELLGTGAGGYGWLLGASGIGGVLGATLSPRIARIGRPRLVIAVLTVLTGVPLASLALIRHPWLACSVLVVEGIAILSLDILVETAMQRGVPRDVLGRVGGLVLSLTAVGTAAGTLLTPPLIAGIGLPGTLALSGLVPVTLAAGFLVLLRELDETTEKTAARLAPRVAVLDRLRLFDGVGRAALERLAAAAREERVAGGAVVLRQGAPADDLLVLVAGDLVVDHDDGSGPRRINTMTAPDYLGEIGLVERVPRTATVTTASDAVLWRITGADFLDAVRAAPSLSSGLTTGIGMRLARTPTARRGPVAQQTPAASPSGQPVENSGARVPPSSTTTTQEDDMNEQTTTPRDDVEGHGRGTPLTDPPRPTASNGDDGEVEGHVARSGLSTAAYQSTAPKADDTDDVSGHLSGALGGQKKTEDDA